MTTQALSVKGGNFHIILPPHLHTSKKVCIMRVL